MTVKLMRSVLACVAGPPDSATNKSGRRNWYKKERNMPDWWRETRIKFMPPSHGISQRELWILIESLQSKVGIVPRQPKYVPAQTDFASRFCRIESK